MQEYYPLIGMAIYLAILSLVGLYWLRSERLEAEERKRLRREREKAESQAAAASR